MYTDQNTGVLTAEGHVEIARSEYILHADKVTYDQKSGIMHAEGHVAILSPTGEVEFSDREEITGDMKQAFAQNIAILFPDNSRFSARMGQRYEGRYTTANQGNYTACNVCKDDPDNPPLWELHGEGIVHDNVEHEIYYHNATIDFAGVPVLYTPYFSAPDPTVDRRQGFLPATPGVSPYIGNFVKIPYYFDIAPETDLVLAPTFSSTDTAQMEAQLRHRTENSNLDFTGSFTRADLISDTGLDQGQQWRGHLFGNYLYNLDNIWRAGTDVQFASDKSYLDRYRISSADQLTNRAYVEGFQGRDYASTNLYYFEDLRAGPQPVQPLVPVANFSALGEPGQTLGGRWSFDGSALDTTRDNRDMDLAQQGPDTRRLSLDGGWQRQFTSNTGLLTTLSGLVRGDAYWADNVPNPDGSGNNYDNVTLARQFEQGNLLMRYPMGRSGDGYQQLLEPLVQLTAAPNVHVSSKQPNEDSLDVEFDETNLFAPNRFTGTDLIEGGNRATYGLRNAVTLDNGARVDVFGGESYDFTKNNDFPEESGLQNHASDYVGRIDFLPVDWINLNYGFRLAQQDLSPQRQDVLLAVGEPIFHPYIRYISAYETETTGLVDQDEEATIGFDSHFAKYWTLSAAHTQAFQPDPGPRSTSLSVSYTDECFIFGVTASNNDTQRVDLSSGTSVVFHLFLRNLGGVHSDSSSTATYAPQFRQY
jgi:LPS-assembly protein